MPFFDKKSGKMNVFYVKTVKISWRLGAAPLETPLAYGGWEFHSQTYGYAPPTLAKSWVRHRL